MGYSPWGHKESDMTERLHFHFQDFSSWNKRRREGDLFFTVALCIHSIPGHNLNN